MKRAWVVSSTHVAIYCAEWALHAAVLKGDTARVLSVADAVDSLKHPGRVFNGYRAQARAARKAVEGDIGAALAEYREARRIWTELHLRMNDALTLTDMALLIGRSHPDGAAAAEEARALWTEFKSPTMLARLDEAMERVFGTTDVAAMSDATASTSVESPTSA